MEPQINFLPNYEDNQKKKQSPGWRDRILLWKNLPNAVSAFDVKFYEAQQSSNSLKQLTNHMPVHAYYVIKLKKKIEQDPYEENSELKNQQNAEEDDMFMH